MAASIDATIGGATANSYNLESEIDAFADEVFPAPQAWLNETEGSDNRIRAMIAATRRLDRENFPRARVDLTQALEWPRAGVLKPETGGLYIGINQGGGGSVAFYTTTEIPQAVKTAHARLTLFLLDQVSQGLDPFASPDGAGIASDNFGGELQNTYEAGATWLSDLDRFMTREIRPLLAQYNLIHSPQVGIVRG